MRRKESVLNVRRTGIGGEKSSDQGGTPIEEGRGKIRVLMESFGAIMVIISANIGRGHSR